MTAANPFYRFPHSFGRAIFLDRINGVLRTGGIVPAGWRQEEALGNLIHVQTKYGDLRHEPLDFAPDFHRSLPSESCLIRARSPLTISRRTWAVRSGGDSRSMIATVHPCCGHNSRACRKHSRSRRRSRFRTQALPTSFRTLTPNRTGGRGSAQ
jgi:hypothetical protein